MLQGAIFAVDAADVNRSPSSASGKVLAGARIAPTARPSCWGDQAMNPYSRFHTPSSLRRSGPATGRQALWLFSAGMLLWSSWRCVIRTHRLRVASRPACLPEPLQTWETEGGRPDPQGIARAHSGRAASTV
jgi:hypothetical protein